MSSSSTSEVSSFMRFFNDDMKNEFIKVKDMVQILIEDQRESVKIHAQLLTMKEEKEKFLQRLHDMEKQLLQAQEALSKNKCEEEVNHSNLSSISSIVNCVRSFEKHIRGIGSKLMFKMSYQEGKGWESMHKAWLTLFQLWSDPRMLVLDMSILMEKNPNP